MSVPAADRRGGTAEGGGGGRWMAGPLLLLGLLVWAVLYPLVFVLGDSLLDGGRFSLGGYGQFFTSRVRLEALLGSIWISLASVVGSAAVGVPLAFLFARREFPGRRILSALAALPVLLPPLVGVLSFLFLFGESGILTRSIQVVFGLPRAPWRLVGPGAILLVHIYSMYVYFYLLVSAGLARMDGSAIEAAESLGATSREVLFRVTLPLLLPSLIGAAILVFMTSMASFSAPYIFGGGYPVLATRIFTSRMNGDLAMAMVETVVLMSVSLVFLLLLRRVEGGRSYVSVGKGTPQGRKTAGSRWLMTGTVTMVVTALLLPHLTLLLISFVPDGAWTLTTLPTRYSLENYRALFSEPDLWTPITNSLRFAAAATVGNLLVVILAARWIVRRRFPGRGLLTSLLSFPFALPGTVIAIALATTFSIHQPWAGRFLWVGTGMILVMAYFIRNLPLVAEPTLASFRQLDPSLEEAAHSLGAGKVRTLRSVVLPLVLPGVAAGGALAFVTALGEFVSSILLHVHRTRPISMEILAQLRAFNFGAAAAMGVLLSLLMAAAFALGGSFLAPGGEKREGRGVPPAV